MLNIFGRGYSDNKEETTFSFREPTLGPVPKRTSNSADGNTLHALGKSGQGKQKDKENPNETQEKDLPQDFAQINAYFQDVVARRRSPYNALVQSANKLQEFIPDEISRLKAARAVCVEQWPPDVLSLALNTHIADIDLARDRVKASRGNSANEQAIGLRQQADAMRGRREKMQAEIAALQRDLQRQQERLQIQDTEIAALQEQLSLMEADAAGLSLIDHAAENLKNDLQAKKILLGLQEEGGTKSAKA